MVGPQRERVFVMRIALIAHDSRKELMAQFCTAYVRILSENDLVATGVTGKIVHDATGLPVRCLYPGGRGGAEQTPHRQTRGGVCIRAAAAAPNRSPR